MQTLIGPILARLDGYAFDIWSSEAGLRRGFEYRRIEDAYYARNVALTGDARWGEPGAIGCDTLDVFVAEVREASSVADLAWYNTHFAAGSRRALAA